MGLDRSSVDALLARIAARTDDLKFEVRQATPSLYRTAYSANVPSSLAQAYAPPPGVDSVLFHYAFKYRQNRFRGWIASSAPHVLEATGILAGAAMFSIDAFDLRYPLPGTPVTLPWTAPYGNAVTSRPSEVPESLLIALANGWRLPGA